jgi:hypothetical protein
MGMAEDPRLTPDVYGARLPYGHCLGEGHLAALDVGASLNAIADGGSYDQVGNKRLRPYGSHPLSPTCPIPTPV